MAAQQCPAKAEFPLSYWGSRSEMLTALFFFFLRSPVISAQAYCRLAVLSQIFLAPARFIFSDSENCVLNHSCWVVSGWLDSGQLILIPLPPAMTHLQVSRMNPEPAAWFSLTMHMTGLLSPPSAASHFLLGGLILQLQETTRACLLLLTFSRDSSGGESLCGFISSSE